MAAVAARVAIPVIGMGGVQSAAHARDLLDVGATLVAVGTESFRDPAAGARIAAGLAAAQRVRRKLRGRTLSARAGGRHRPRWLAVSGIA